MEQKQCCCGGKDEKLEKLKEIIGKHKSRQGALIPILHEAQELYGYLPLEVQKTISEGLNVPLSEIYGVATFYTRFSLQPKGKNTIQVCLGTSCYVKGSEKVLERVKNRLGINEGETTEDGLFSLDTTRCIGACGLAPVMMINEDVYGKVTPDMIDGILAKYKE
jgi:NADP-reducing hydrogenase subunit HndA